MSTTVLLLLSGALIAAGVGMIWRDVQKRRRDTFVVQREACGLRKIDHVIQVYGVPNEVVARMGPLARPSIHPTKTMAAEVALPPMF